jgi:predicted RNase H-like nuclease (RuvC/YqgF family)
MGDFNFNMFSSNKVQVDEDFLKENLEHIKSDVKKELDSVKCRIEYVMQERLQEHARQLQRTVSELKMDMAESKEYVQQLHNELEKNERRRKKDRAEIVNLCIN